jgi:PKD repeat protein
MTWNANPGLPRLRWLTLAVTIVALFAGCAENTVPQITQLAAEPDCDIITPHDDGDYLEVRFFARASGGNIKSDPTGANSPLDWSWDFGDGSGAGNIVNPVHRYTAAGEYEIVLTVKDDDGDSDQRKISVVVGASYGDLDILAVSAEKLGDSRISFTRVDSLSQFTGWEADFAGHIATPCPVGGLFQTYFWRWTFNDGTFAEHIGEPTHVFPPTAEDYQVYLSVTENNTLVARADTVSASYPAGSRLSNTAFILLPDDSLTLRMDGLLTEGLNQLDISFSWPDSFQISATAAATTDVQNEGFILTQDNSVPGLLSLSFQSAAGMTRSDETIPFADITFSRPAVTVRLPVGLLQIKLADITVTTLSGAPRAANGVGGEFDLDNDCNDNQIPDRFEEDCNENGFVDSCDIALGLAEDCNDNGVPDSCDLEDGTLVNCNRSENDIPDECEIAAGLAEDCNDNGVPDDCELDCNFNGIPDECDIANGTSLDCNDNGVPDECEPDCNNNGIPDECDIADGTSLDCNAGTGGPGDGVPDECEPDCNNNGIPDACDIADGTSLDCNENGIPDECDVDCNANGIPDECDIQDGTSQDLNGNGVPDDCE